MSVANPAPVANNCSNGSNSVPSPFPGPAERLNPSAPAFCRAVAISLNNCGVYQHLLGEHAKAIKYYQQACKVRETALKIEDQQYQQATQRVLDSSASLSPTSTNVTSSTDENRAHDTDRADYNKMDVDADDKQSKWHTQSEDQNTKLTCWLKNVRAEESDLRHLVQQAEQQQQQQRFPPSSQGESDTSASTTVSNHSFGINASYERHRYRRRKRPTTKVDDRSNTGTPGGTHSSSQTRSSRRNHSYPRNNKRNDLKTAHQQQLLDLLEAEDGEDVEFCLPSLSAALPSTMRVVTEEHYGWCLGAEPLLIEPYVSPCKAGDICQINNGSRPIDQERDYLDSSRTLFNMALLHLDGGSDSQSANILGMALSVMPSGSNCALRCHIMNHVALTQARLGLEEKAVSTLDKSLSLGREAFRNPRLAPMSASSATTQSLPPMMRPFPAAHPMLIQQKENSYPSCSPTAQDNSNSCSNGRRGTLPTQWKKQPHRCTKYDCSSVDISTCVSDTLGLLARVHRSLGNTHHATTISNECLRVRTAYFSTLTEQHPQGHIAVVSNTSTPISGLILMGSGGKFLLAHPDVACNYFNLGLILAEDGKLQEGMSYMEQFVDWVRLTYEGQHQAHANFSHVSSSVSSPSPSLVLQSEAANQLCHAVETFARIHLFQHISFTKAVSALELSLILHRAYPDPSCVDIARTLHQLGLLHGNLGSMRESILYYREATETFQSILGPEDPDVASVLCDEGLYHAERGESDEALFCYHQALRIARQNLADSDNMPTPDLFDDSPERSVVELLNVIGNVLLERGDSTQAMSAFSEAQRVITHYRIAGLNLPCHSTIPILDVNGRDFLKAKSCAPAA